MEPKRRKSDPYTPEEIKDIFDTLKKYEDVYRGAEADIIVKGKELTIAVREHAQLAYFYNVRKAEIKTMLKQAATRKAAIRGRLHRWFKENDSLDSSERQIEKYIDAHDDFISAEEVENYIDEVYHYYLAIEDAFNKRGFNLRDLTRREFIKFIMT